MALTKLSVAILILTLTIAFEIQYVEGRHLKQRTVHKNTSGKIKGRHGVTYANEALLTKPMAQTPPTKSPANTIVESQLQSPPPPHGVEDFRPTAPGHSPGAGHTIQN
ncbi:precursor of CEP3-like protein [Tanacetum coccineum]